ncbi:MAG: hypothetical protein RXQ70_04795 [Sulfolobaceae archaeon]|nr:hypothetical protein [Sulfolobales archaeon]
MSELQMMADLSDKVDYRITSYASYPHDVEIIAIVMTNATPDDSIISKVSEYGNVTKVFSFMNVIKVRGRAKDIVRLAEEQFVSYIMLDEVITS